MEEIRELINLTPHEITLLVDGVKIIFPSKGEARLTPPQRKKIGEITIEDVKIPVFRNEFSNNVIGLPAPKKGVGYIVSRLVAETIKDRDDLFIVDATVRDDKGRVIGATALAKI